MIIFKDWKLRYIGDLLARQNDNLSRLLLVEGVPDGYDWVMKVQVQLNGRRDSIPLRKMDGGVGAVLTENQLAYAGYYSLQLMGTLSSDGVTTRHTNQLRVYIGPSLAGGGDWPEVPSEYTQFEDRLRELNQHPPVPGPNGYWMIWNTEADKYEESDFVLPSGEGGGDPITPESIGAAPAGYGLGEKNGKYITDTNDATEGGWYRWGTDIQNAPFSYGAMRVDPRLTGSSNGLVSIMQTAYSDNYPGCVAQRKIVDSNFETAEWEWANPPMVSGTEYRTTERYKQKAVYKKLDTDGVIKWRLDGETTWKPEAESIGAASKNLVESDLLVPKDTEDPASYLDNLLDEYIATKPNGSVGFIKIQLSTLHPTLSGGQYIASVSVITQSYVSIEAISYASGTANNIVRKYTRSKCNDVWGEWTAASTASSGGSGGTPSAHASTHATGGSDPITPASIGAAPAGYGSFGETLTDALVLDDEDGALLRNKLIEIAQSMEAPNTKRIFFHAAPFVEAYWNFGIVSSFVNETGKLRVILDAYMTNGHVWKMMYKEGDATEWTEPEFQNPILLVGKEYRTTERYQNKAVYKKLDTDGVIKWRLDGETTWHTDKPISKSITLSASGWNSTAKTQTTTVSGVLADETKQLITPTPAMASQDAYYNAGIRCTGQSADKLTFTAKTIPTADLTVYVTIQEVGA